MRELKFALGPKTGLMLWLIVQCGEVLDAGYIGVG